MLLDKMNVIVYFISSNKICLTKRIKYLLNENKNSFYFSWPHSDIESSCKTTSFVIGKTSSLSNT